MMVTFTILSLVSLFISYTAAAPVRNASDPTVSFRSKAPLRLTVDHRGKLAPLIEIDFPDPSVIKTEDGTWYAFATNGNDKTIQVAKANYLLGHWEVLDQDPLPHAEWMTGGETWAPDVRIMDDGSYVMYFSAKPKEGGKHCIGVARSEDALGPYKPDREPFACHIDQGGAIDASGFRDPETGRRYVAYKVDGNTIGHGGKCNNSVEPRVPTPIMLQQVDPDDGSSKIKPPVQILDRTDDDGPLVEAPNLLYVDGWYVLFYSSHCFSQRKYDIKYAYSKEVTGPYQRGEQMVASGDFGLDGPGGMTASESGKGMVFHGRCKTGEESEGRCMYAVRINIEM